MKTRSIFGMVVTAFWVSTNFGGTVLDAETRKTEAVETKRQVGRPSTSSAPEKTKKARKIIDVSVRKGNDGFTRVTIIGDGELGPYETYHFSSLKKVL